MLVAQALQINEANLTTSSHHHHHHHILSPSRLQDASSEEDWLRILNEALRDLSYVFIVLDSDLLNYAATYNRHVASKCVTAIRNAVSSTMLKIFVSSFSVDTFTFDINLASEDWEVFETGSAVRRGARQGSAAKRRAFKRRRRG